MSPAEVGKAIALMRDEPIAKSLEHGAAWDVALDRLILYIIRTAALDPEEQQELRWFAEGND